MSRVLFAVPQECERAYYRAIETADLTAMMAVWAEDDEIVCIHPGGPRLTGPEAIRESWRAMFAGGPSLRFVLSHEQRIVSVNTALHSVLENIHVIGEPRERPPIIATNVYVRTDRGWRMIVHHASPAPARPPEPRRESAPRVLH
jgi:uncharacterized protein (TIGR02246 family)